MLIGTKDELFVLSVRSKYNTTSIKNQAMKRINSIIILLLGVFLSFSFVSCNSDDDDSNSSSFDSNNPQLGTWVLETIEHKDYTHEAYDDHTIRTFKFTKSSGFSMQGESYITTRNEYTAQHFYEIDVNGNIVKFPLDKEVHFVWQSDTGEYSWNSEANEATIYGVHDGSRASIWSIRFKFSPDFNRAYISFRDAYYHYWEGWYDRK